MCEAPVLYVLYSRVCCNGHKLVWYSCEVSKITCIKPLNEINSLALSFQLHDMIIHTNFIMTIINISKPFFSLNYSAAKWNCTYHEISEVKTCCKFELEIRWIMTALFVLECWTLSYSDVWCTKQSNVTSWSTTKVEVVTRTANALIWPTLVSPCLENFEKAEQFQFQTNQMSCDSEPNGNLTVV